MKFGDQFGRKWRVTIDDLQFSSNDTAKDIAALTCRFKVDTDKTFIANNCELRAFNLTESRREQIETADGAVVQIEAGYREGAFSTIFLGVLTDAESEYSDSTWITAISSADGEDKLSRKISVTWPAGTSHSVVLTAMVNALGVKPGNVRTLILLENRSGSTSLEVPFTSVGSVANELKWFAQSIGVEWSIQQGEFVGSAVSTPAILGGPIISAATGLVGTVRVNSGGEKPQPREPTPTKVPGAISGRSLMIPGLQPNMAIRIESRKVTGDFITQKVSIVGDTTGQEWYTDFEANPL